ncbi:hypothetical protein ABZ553_33855 [Streptomyces sparsogenes]|uniref:hypothetical protein n=1 Tax=Streptomyces sparsogenes TaxID=67365 RepID=UPI0034079F62
MDAGEEWRAKAGLWARATLPDGQELDVVGTGRYRSKDGCWWYECEAILPARYEHADGRTQVTGAPTPISVLVDDINPHPRRGLLPPAHRWRGRWAAVGAREASPVQGG